MIEIIEPEVIALPEGWTEATWPCISSDRNKSMWRDKYAKNI
jgi:hypothetical protein